MTAISNVDVQPDDPQAALLDALSDDVVLELLGPSWEKMTPAARRAYAYPAGRMPDVTMPRRWWEAA